MPDKETVFRKLLEMLLLRDLEVQFPFIKFNLAVKLMQKFKARLIGNSETLGGDKLVTPFLSILKINTSKT